MTARLARCILGLALIAGVAGDLVLRPARTGVGVPIWFAIAALVFVAMVGRAGRKLSAESAGWLAAAVLFSVAVAWRESETLATLNFLAAAAALGMASLALADPQGGLLAPRLRDFVRTMARAIARLVAGVMPLLPPIVRSVVAPPTVRALGAGALARSALIAVAVLLVFGSLLRDADPIFASVVALPAIDMSDVLPHVVFGTLCTWLVGGWAVGALSVHAPISRTTTPPPWGLGGLDLVASLGMLNLLFGGFVLAQLGWFFGGERFLLARTGLTAAAYARQGFFQMLCVVMLVVPVLLATRAALRPSRELTRRHTLLSLPLLALLGIMIVSAMLRMRLYTEYFGLTTQRFYPLVFMAWLSVLLALIATTILRDRGRRFVAGAMLSALATLTLLDIAAPDAIVARVNLARSAEPAHAGRSSLDLEHLSRLSGDAVDLSVRAVLATPPGAESEAHPAEPNLSRCIGARVLLARWGPGSPAASRREQLASWRQWNAGEAHAMEIVGRHAAALRAVTRSSGMCARRRS